MNLWRNVRTSLMCDPMIIVRAWKREEKLIPRFIPLPPTTQPSSRAEETIAGGRAGALCNSTREEREAGWQAEEGSFLNNKNKINIRWRNSIRGSKKISLCLNDRLVSLSNSKFELSIPLSSPYFSCLEVRFWSPETLKYRRSCLQWHLLQWHSIEPFGYSDTFLISQFPIL